MTCGVCAFFGRVSEAWHPAPGSTKERILHANLASMKAGKIAADLGVSEQHVNWHLTDLRKRGALPPTIRTNAVRARNMRRDACTVDAM